MRHLLRLSVRADTCLVAALLTVGCSCSDVPIGANDRPDAGPDARRPAPRLESCGNGMDDDGDELVDDGCPCAPGETQSCFSGEYPSRGVGSCRDGVQTCAVAPGVEWGDWGDHRCEGDVLPMTEMCDGMDHDCDGMRDEGCPCTVGATRPCGGDFPTSPPCRAGTQTCTSEGTWDAVCEGAVGPEPEVCDNAVDDDCDGEVDPRRLCSCVPVPEVCGNGTDDDCDGAVDEPDACSPTCVPLTEVCGDGTDQDCDGADLVCPDAGPIPTDAGAGPVLDAAAPTGSCTPLAVDTLHEMPAYYTGIAATSEAVWAGSSSETCAAGAIVRVSLADLRAAVVATDVAVNQMTAVGDTLFASRSCTMGTHGRAADGSIAVLDPLGGGGIVAMGTEIFFFRRAGSGGDLYRVPSAGGSAVLVAPGFFANRLYASATRVLGAVVGLPTYEDGIWEWSEAGGMRLVVRGTYESGRGGGGPLGVTEDAVYFSTPTSIRRAPLGAPTIDLASAPEVHTGVDLEVVIGLPGDRVVFTDDFGLHMLSPGGAVTRLAPLALDELPSSEPAIWADPVYSAVLVDNCLYYTEQIGGYFLRTGMVAVRRVGLPL